MGLPVFLEVVLVEVRLGDALAEFDADSPSGFAVLVFSLIETVLSVPVEPDSAEFSVLDLTVRLVVVFFLT
jgi:hypothetical protein